MTLSFIVHGDTRRLILQRYTPLCVILALFWINACSQSAVQRTAHPPVKRGAQVEQRLRQAASQWAHTPHRLGGLDRRGVDCSGLVKVLYKDIFNVPLPRTSSQQAKQGMAVKQKQLTAGDLVFFKPPDKGSHVGIYLSKGQFLHVTTRRGVIVSDLKEHYWRNSYWTARRVLPS